MTQAFDVPINAALNINQALGIAPGDFFPPRPYLIQNVGEGSLSSSLLYGDYPTAPDPCTAPGHPLGRNQSRAGGAGGLPAGLHLGGLAGAARSSGGD